MLTDQSMNQSINKFINQSETDCFRVLIVQTKEKKIKEMI